MFVALATWVLGAGARGYFADQQLATDCSVFGLIAAWMAREQLAELLRNSLHASGASVGSSIVAFALITGPLAVLGFQSQRESKNNASADENAKGVSKWTLPYPKARIFPCETKHARMFPKRHAFEYSYLQCGFPIIPGGVDADGQDVATGTDQVLGSWWLRVRAADYLTRGNGKAGFYGKLQTFMKEHNVDDNDWSYAYLVTAPRFLGYSFNPVSFWYIYDREHQLRKMILEVNNTFGERRIYLLNGTGPSTTPHTPDSTHEADTALDILTGTKSRFNDLWMKDFHVSPFNSRKGSYALKAQNPFPYVGFEEPMIDNTITLKSSKDHAKIVARLNCVGKPLDPEEFGLFGAAWFISRWWWVGLVTFPRIVKEAGNLFYKRSLHVWFRPEVLTPSLGRLPTSQEVTIQQGFNHYLTHLVSTAQDDFRIILHTTIPEIPKQTIDFTRPSRGDTMKELEIRVLTPAFYSRFVHYAYTSEAFDRECVFTDEKNRTCWVSRPELLAQLLVQATSVASQRKAQRGYLTEAKWWILKKLRCAPAAPAYNATPKDPECRLEDIRGSKYSEMEAFVRSQRPKYAGEYRRIATKLFLAQNFCFGYPQVLTLIDRTLRVLLGYFAAKQILLPDASVHDWWSLSGRIIAATACNAYALLKGYH